MNPTILKDVGSNPEKKSLKKGGKFYLFCVEIGSSRPIVRFPLEESPNPNIIKQLGPPPRGQIQDHWCSHLDLSQTSTPSCSPLKPSPLIEGDLYRSPSLTMVAPNPLDHLVCAI